jgi:hypothetical protein
MIEITLEEQVKTTRRLTKSKTESTKKDDKDNGLIGKKRKRKVPDFYIPIKV